MAIDLKTMNRKDLEKLLSDVRKALANAQARERRDAKKAAERAAAEFGFSLAELTEGAKPAGQKTKPRAPRSKSKPKFANPADKTQTWTGKGRQPNWYREEIEKGAAPDSMKV